MNFISCVKWVKKGASKPVPDKINFTEEELKNLISETQNENASNPTEKPEQRGTVSGDEFDFAQYDDEDAILKANLRDIVSFDEDDKKKSKKALKKKKRRQIDDSDSEDEIIQADDNLILVGQVDDDFNSLNVYVYNENDGDMYVHHDLILKSAPLCVEWLNADDGSDYNNLCAVGEMDPVIGIWDLDMMNCVVPIYKLGRAKKKNPSKNHGHTDAVLSLAWNSELPHILCSGSVDNRGLLWDLHSGKVATELTVFTDKVQSVLWNPHDPYSLLTACADGYLRNFDCRVFDQFQKWNLKSAVECLLPHPENEYYCFAATENGLIHQLDYRKKKPIFSFQAHSKEITGLSLNKNNSNILISVSADENMRFWDINKEFECIFSQNPKLGPLYCIDMNPDYPYLACVGGSHENRNKVIMKVLNMDNVLESRETSHTPVICTDSTIESFEVPLLENNDIKVEPSEASVSKKRKKISKVPKKKKNLNLSKKKRKMSVREAR